MTSISWLHLADLHLTVNRPGWMAPSTRDVVRRNLAKLHKRVGQFDLLLIAGDLTLRGAPEEFEEAQASLGVFLDMLRELGSTPCVLAVPGNHDLVRPRGALSAIRSLQNWHRNPEIREEFWSDSDSSTRRLVDRALQPFATWWIKLLADLPQNRVRNVRRGLLPGDFTATIVKDDIRIGVAGLCSAFLQVTGDDYHGRLALDPLQLTVASGGDVPSWIAKHDATILMTHHPTEWLAPEDQARYDKLINPIGRFCAHLSGHGHNRGPRILTDERVEIGCPAFFGLARWEKPSGQMGFRYYGFLAGCLELDEQDGRLEIHSSADRKSCIAEMQVERFPRLEDKRVDWPLERSALRDELAAAYSSAVDARRLARTARVPIDHAASGGAAVDVWHVVVNCLTEKKLDAVAGIAQRELPDNQRIAEKWEAYKRAMAPQPTAIRHGSTEEKLVNELYERMIALVPAAFASVVTRLSLESVIPGPTAPQSTRAIALLREMVNREGRSGLEKLGAVILSASGIRVPYMSRGDTDSESGWLGHLGEASFGGLISTALSSSLAKQQNKHRKPTKASLAELLTLMFDDERDFDGFVLDHFPGIYRRFHSGMNRSHRVGLLLDAADGADVVSRLKRAFSSAFQAHQGVIDYEEDGEPVVRFRKVQSG